MRRTEKLLQCLHFQSTAREEFPWLALLEYRKGERNEIEQKILDFKSFLPSHRRDLDKLCWQLSKPQIRIDGRPLSDRRHHPPGRLLVSYKSQIDGARLIGKFSFRANVRLGDHDLSLSKNCVGRNCGNPMRVNEIDEVIPHESFNPRAINRRHDIGLVRLKSSVRYSSKRRLSHAKSSSLAKVFHFQESFDQFVFRCHRFPTCEPASRSTSPASGGLCTRR